MDHSPDRRGRLVGFTFLAIVVVGIALLIAGYGVAVGLGALAGLVLGAVAGTWGSLWLSRGSGRSVSFGSMTWSSEHDTAEMFSEMQAFSDILERDLGPVRSVHVVLATVDASGLSVQLVTVEQREAGLQMTIDIRRGYGAPHLASMARVQLTDDVGTSYMAAAQGVAGSAAVSRYQVTAVPATPAAAARLDLVIDRIDDPFPSGGVEIVGPWRFEVPLERADPPSP